MSARDLIMPLRALEGFVNQATQRVAALERRAVWSPAVVSDGIDFDGLPDGIPGGIQDSTDPSYPQPGTYVAGVTLDPGRWIIMARVWGELTINTGSGGEMGMYISPIGLYKSKQWGLSTFQRRQTFEHAFEVTADEPYSVTLWLYAGAPPGWGPYSLLSLWSSLIVAFPG